MKVELVNYTKDAAELMIYSKKVRLSREPISFEEVYNMDPEQKKKELSYIFGSIGSTLEFVDYTFLLGGVSRAFTHQLVRHRVGTSFAQQSLRTVDAGNFDYLITGNIKHDLELREEYDDAMFNIKQAYKFLVGNGALPQDARGLLPTNILTNILFKVNLRSLSNIINVRLCFKTQGEFQDVAKRMREQVLIVHPWAEPALKVHCAQYGTCLFPGYKECPVKKEINFPNENPASWDQQNLSFIEEAWSKIDYEAKPKGEGR